MKKALLLSVVGLFACAHVPPPQVEGLRMAAESFHQRLRWKDFQGASMQIIPDRQSEFLASRKKWGDEKNLSVSDYELLEGKLSPDASTATFVSEMSWVRLPSLSEQSAQVTTHFALINGQWWVVRQEGGPFEELSTP